MVTIELMETENTLPGNSLAGHHTIHTEQTRTSKDYIHYSIPSVSTRFCWITPELRITVNLGGFVAFVYHAMLARRRQVMFCQGIDLIDVGIMRNAFSDITQTRSTLRGDSEALTISRPVSCL